MAIFRDTEHLYQVLDAFFHRVAARPAVANGLLAGGFVLRFRYTDPAGQVTVDLRRAPLSWTFGDSEQRPDLEMIQSADVAHQFWLGRLNVPAAIATRRVVSRGPVAKALKLLPAVKPTYALYADALRELGYEGMIPAEPARSPGLPGVHRLLAGARRVARRVIGRAPRAFDRAELLSHTVPVARGVSPVLEPRTTTVAGPLRVEMLRRMLQIRLFEQAISDANARGDVPTEAIHLSIGQEATAVGVCLALRDDDAIASTHRGHGHMLAKGADLYGMMAEIFAKADGLCKGKGGSMHVTDARVGAIGANGIVGASPLIAAGAAHAFRLSGDDRVAVAFMGDGATNQGMFHEALNFAAVMRLPAVFVVENNGYGEFTPLGRHMRIDRIGTIAARAAAYGIDGVTVDGNDVDAVHAAALAAVARARAGEGPTLLECMTYRWHGHMEGEAVAYRPADEIAAWQDRCPVAAHERRLIAEGALSAEEAAALRGEAERQVTAALERAMAAPDPAPDAVFDDVFAPEPAALFTPAEPPPATRETTCSGALFEALSEELERDERVYLLGEDVTTGGYFSVTVGLVDRFGTDRIVDTPISEYAIVGSAVGAAMCGRRPVAEILFSDFLTTCADPLINQAAKLRTMSGGQYTLPLVVRTPGGAGLGMAAQHSQSLEALLTGIPGLIIVAPATPADAKGLLKAAIRSDNPVIFFENKLLYTMTGPVPDGDVIVPLGVADIKRPGRDVTVVSVGAALGKALEAAEALRTEGVEVEVVDVRTLVPLDVATIARSVARTGRLVTVEDGPLFHGFGAEIVARVCELTFDALHAAPRRVAALDVPIPYNSGQENYVIPSAERVAEAIRAVLR